MMYHCVKFICALGKSCTVGDLVGLHLFRAMLFKCELDVKKKPWCKVSAMYFLTYFHIGSPMKRHEMPHFFIMHVCKHTWLLTIK